MTRATIVTALFLNPFPVHFGSVNRLQRSPLRLDTIAVAPPLQAALRSAMASPRAYEGRWRAWLALAV